MVTEELDVRRQTDVQEINRLLNILVGKDYFLEIHVTSEFKWNKIIIPKYFILKIEVTLLTLPIPSMTLHANTVGLL